jgi:VWFA-related protein
LKRRPLAAALVALAVFAPQQLTGARTAARQGEAGGAGPLRFELPAGGDVRVENRLGGVRVETWGENFLEVAAVSDGPAPAGAASPVRVERAERLLSITVAGRARPAVASRPARAAATAARVDLTLRVPAETRLTIFTSDGAIEVRGQTARLDAQTVSGDLRVELPTPADADVMARTLRGTITARAGLTDASPERVMRDRFQARLGAGRRIVRLASTGGHIELGALAEAAQASGETQSPRATPRAARPGASVNRDAAVPGAASGTPGAASASAADAPPERRRPPVLVGARGDEDGGRAPAAAATAATPATPAPGATLEVDDDEVVVVDTHVVTLNLSVVDRTSGRGVTGLSREDFRVFEDNVEQPLTHFESASAPFDLLLLVDLSGSTAAVKDVIRAACLRFVESVRPRDRVGVVAFAGTHAVVSPLTDDKRLLRTRLEAMGAPAGDTKLYDAVNFSLEHLVAQSPKGRRRAVVLLSDGLDSVLPNVQGDGSALAYEELRRRVQEFDGLLYTVWTDNSYDALSPLDIQPETFDLVYDRMEELAALGGGVFHEVAKLEDLAGVYQRVVEDLGTVYSLTFQPANKTRDGRWRAVRVRLPRRPEAVARGRNGYYAK